MLKRKDETLSRFLKNHSTSAEQDWTHTRIGDRKLGIHGGKFTIISQADLRQLYKLVGKEVLTNNGMEYLTERQNKNGPVLIDLDFRYDLDVVERQHDSTHIDDIITVSYTHLTLPTNREV